MSRFQPASWFGENLRVVDVLKRMASRGTRSGRCCEAGPLAAIVIALLIFRLFLVAPAVAADARPTVVKNVILLVVDGCSSEQYTLARWFKGGPLAIDEIRCGAVKTLIADSVIADSAPAATALATGHFSNDKLIGVAPSVKTVTVPPPNADEQLRPLATLLEAARLQGKATGIVATSRVTHATPAGFMAHVTSRKMEEEIMEQAVHQGVNVVLGGGRDFALPKSAGGARRDGQNLVDTLRRRGYEVVENREQLQNARGSRVFGLFALGPMAPEIDRPRIAPSEPTLAEMTRKAIELLSADDDGFFLMVEGSQVDWACHANDPAHLISDLLAYDDAVAVALDFACRDGTTLLIALSDHNTGGMSIGNMRTSRTYSQTTIADLVEPLRKMRCSAVELWKRIVTGADGKKRDPKDISPEVVRLAVKEGWGMEITEEDAKQILAVALRDKSDPQNAFGEVLCPRYTVLGWTTHGHAGGDVPLHAWGPDRPVGTFDQPQIARRMAQALGVDLDATSNRLFVEVASEFAADQLEWDGGKTVLRIRHRDTIAELPINKNLLRIGGEEIVLEGIVVHIAETGKTYVPRQAVRRIRGE